MHGVYGSMPPQPAVGRKVALPDVFGGIPIRCGPRHGDAWPSGSGLTVALPFLQRVSSVPRVTWGSSSTLRLTAEKKGLEGMVEQPERYCSNCGHELKPEDQFCSNCGMPVHRAARVPTPMADRPVPPLPPPTREAGRRSFRGSGALRGRWRKLVVVLVVGALLLYL